MYDLLLYVSTKVNRFNTRWTMTTAMQLDAEHRAAQCVCELLDEHAEVVTQNEPPMPDFTLNIAGHQVHIELACYREQGQYNEAYERDEEFKKDISSRWKCDPHLSNITVHFRYCEKNRHFLIPSDRRSSGLMDAIVKDLRQLAATFCKSHLKQHVDIRIVPGDKVQKYQRWKPRHRYVSRDDFPLLAQYCQSCGFSVHPGVPAGYPVTSLNTRFMGIDLAEIQRVIRGKLQKLPKYKAAVNGEPVHLFMYSEGYPSTASLPSDEHVESVLHCIREVLDSSQDRFDRVWWGNDILLRDPSLYRVR